MGFRTKPPMDSEIPAAQLSEESDPPSSPTSAADSPKASESVCGTDTPSQQSHHVGQGPASGATPASTMQLLTDDDTSDAAPLARLVAGQSGASRPLPLLHLSSPAVAPVEHGLAEDTDSSDAMPLSQLATRHQAVGHRPFALPISPTLPFSAEDPPLRGGAPRSAAQQPPRTTWEGENSSSMLSLLTTFVDANGQELQQIHISAAATDATGVFLTNWASWHIVANLKSDKPLVAVLPGKRVFEVDMPAEDCVATTDVVIQDSKVARRFPRHVTTVQLGRLTANPPQVETTVMLPAPTAPIEMLIEVDSRIYKGADARLAVKNFISDALRSAGAHNKAFSERWQHQDPNVAYSIKLKVSLAQSALLLNQSGASGIFVRPSRHSQHLLAAATLIWLDADAMAETPLKTLADARAQISLSSSLVRSLQW
eukprot:3887046-Amphidinium_carterae.1